MTCWNCKEEGHISADCTKPYKGFCSGCGARGQKRATCSVCNGDGNNNTHQGEEEKEEEKSEETGMQGTARYIEQTEDYEGVGYYHGYHTEEDNEVHMLRRTIFNEYYRPPPDYYSETTQSQLPQRPDLLAIKQQIMHMLTGSQQEEEDNDDTYQVEEDEWIVQAMKELEGDEQGCPGCHEC